MTEINNIWFQFLIRHGAQISEPGSCDISGFADGQGIAANGFIAPLTDLGLIRVSGDDAAHFLQSQLTNDIEHLASSEARLAGYCSPKGRLLATMLAWKSGEYIFLQLPRAILPAIKKRLQMFVLRAKVKLEDVTDQYAVLGLIGPGIAQALAAEFPALPETVYRKAETPTGILIRMPDADRTPRFLWVADLDTAQRQWESVSKRLQPAGTAAWRLTNIRAGIPEITAPTQEQFVPQMINFELIGGVSFKKGCYPGQEIVARSQYLGKLKRRMMLASVAAARVQAGMEVFSSTDPGQPCGMIVNAEASAPGHYECLVEAKISAFETGTVHLASADGPVLHLGTLPYSLSDKA